IQRMARVVVKHNYSEQYRVADALAKQGAKTNFLGRTTMLPAPPVFANELFWTDIVGIEVTRNILACNIDNLEQSLSDIGGLQYPPN
ncbi:hypothetical protein A4A49_63319, partial [Nicotiana attenuata]